MSKFETVHRRVEVLSEHIRPHAERARGYLGLAVRRIRPITDVVSPLGWAVLIFGFACWLIGVILGWTELLVVGTAAWVLLLLCVLLTVGRARLKVTLTADPQRVVVGAPAAGSVQVRNMSRKPLLPIGLELPLGAGAARFTMPFLGPGSEHEELFVVPTARRGVVVVGPASTVRGDPLGLLRRTSPWTESLEIFVHPITVRLESLGAGFLRDLEGQTTNDLSMSDLAFHALRDYQPGDDRRYIHWRSSAKAGRFLVRQFLDTRRSHIAVCVDSHKDSYGDPEDYELAISAAASLTIRVVQDEQEVTVLAGEHVAPSATGSRVLDIYSRAELATHGLTDLARRANRIAPDLSTVFLICGANTSPRELQHAASEFPQEVRRVAVQVDPTRSSGISEIADIRLLRLQRLSDLVGMFQAVLA
jgi:uncharacterized protein (DUF58 family)